MFNLKIEYFKKEYHERNYNCSHFVRDVWLDLTGFDITDMVGAWNNGKLADAMKSRHGIIKLEQPENPCLVIFQAPKITPHIGIWIDDKILHITDSGVRWDDLNLFELSYKTWNFYKCALNW